MKGLVIAKGKNIVHKGEAVFQVEKNLNGNGTTRNFSIAIPELATLPNVDLYIITGTGINQIATRVKDNLYTVIINQFNKNLIQINFTTAPVNLSVYKVSIMSF